MTCAICFARVGAGLALLGLTACAVPVTPPPEAAPTLTVTLQRVRTATPRPSPTVWPTPAILASLTPTPTPPTYVVQRGDTLLSIALRLGVTLEALQAANPGVNPQFLSIGTALRVPGGAGTPPPNLGPALTVTPLPVRVQGAHCQAQITGAVACWAEVHNPTAEPVAQVAVRFILADAGGLPLTSVEAAVAVETLRPGQTAPVGVVARVNAPVRAVQAEVVQALPGVWPALTVQVREPRLLAHGAGWRLAGALHNPASQGVAGARLTVSVYTQAQQVAGFWQVEVAAPLAPGATQPFDVPLGALADRALPARFAVLAEPLP